MSNVKITILTVAKNSSDVIEELIDSLNSQDSMCFHWLVIDGSDDLEVANIITAKANCSYEIVASNDFSIYHALNIGVSLVKTDYYVVAGSDDHFSNNFISVANAILDANSYDIILGSVQVADGKIHVPSLRYGFFAGTNAAHSVGTIIKTQLHSKCGYYSNRYPIVADKFFIKKVLISGASAAALKTVFGFYGQTGFSSLNKVDYVCDLFKMQVHLGENMLMQILLLFFRLLKIFWFEALNACSKKITL